MPMNIEKRIAMITEGMLIDMGTLDIFPIE
jgi:hypothetical protein